MTDRPKSTRMASQSAESLANLEVTEKPDALGTHPDLVPVIASILLAEGSQKALACLSSTCKWNQGNLRTHVEQAKRGHHVVDLWKAEELHAGQRTPAQWALMR